jgi:phage tail-like protein
MSIDMGLGRQQPTDPGARETTLTSATFVVECGGKSAVFSELGGISSEVEQSEYMEAGLQGPTFGRFIGRAKPPTVSLKRSMTKTGGSTTWIWTWHASARNMKPDAYRDCMLKLFGAGSDAPVKTYFLNNAIPTKVEIAGMKAGGTEVVLQTVTLMCDAIEEMP